MRLVRDQVTVTVPATCANLGPGFDSFGLAVAIHDVVQVRATTGATRVHVSGAGAQEVPDGEEHLVVRAMRVALDQVGAPQAGLELRCANAIPHGRGLGSSAAAVVAGLLAVRELISEPEALDDGLILQVATELEGHPDNAAPALHGGATIAWTDQGQAHAAQVPVHDLEVTVLIPQRRLSTSRARTALPRTIAHADAAANSARAGLLTLALGSRPDLLFAATQDWLHQRYRADVMPESLELLDRLRRAGLPAVISGAGPTLLLFGALPAEQLATIPAGWRVRHPDVDRHGPRVAAP
ncbi:homoserine kinase [Pseudactinotalea sp. Z1739]|uniref:homoserine kinase n=1 Tax=Pseudactinotalea sp. Z1739 TaxID=3413028 RepID=UPI003C7D47A6